MAKRQKDIQLQKSAKEKKANSRQPSPAKAKEKDKDLALEKLESLIKKDGIFNSQSHKKSELSRIIQLQRFWRAKLEIRCLQEKKERKDNGQIIAKEIKKLQNAYYILTLVYFIEDYQRVVEEDKYIKQ